MDEQTIENYVARKQAGEEYSVIRKELHADGYSEDEIRAAIRQIDALFLDSIYKPAKSEIDVRKWIGMVVILLSIAVIILTSTGAINVGGTLFPIGFLLIGLILLGSRRSKNGKHVGNFRSKQRF